MVWRGGRLGRRGGGVAGGIVFFLGGVRSISRWTEEYITLLLDVSYASFSSEKALRPAGIARVLHRAESTLHMHAHYIRNKCMLCFISQFLNIVISLASSERGPPIYATSHGAWSRDNEILRWAATETGRAVDLDRCRGYQVELCRNKRIVDKCRN